MTPTAEARAAAAKEGATNEASQGAGPHLCVFAAGKGGVGRTLLAVNGAVYLANMGYRVVLFDADLGNCNLHTLLGAEPPDRTLDDFVHKRVDSLNALVVPTRVANLGLVSAARDPIGAASLKHGPRTRLFTHLASIQADYVVVDTPVGTGLTTLDFFNLAHGPVAVTVATPAATERLWRFICAAFIRSALRVGPPAPARALLEEAFDQSVGRPAPSPGALVRAARALDEASATAVEQARARFRPALIVNEARTRADAELGEAIRVLARDRLDVDLDVLGTLSWDEAAWISVSRRRPVVVEAPESPFSQQIEQLVHRLRARVEAHPPATAAAPAAGVAGEAPATGVDR
ncbi:MAG TPA: P-loop NTPase [Myxococcota bacterium]|jgi:flagellar biosynthesis protein FlhG|nr:P-loop NTPase [Myxococcota bacterium]